MENGSVSERIAQMVEHFHKGNKSAFAKTVGISNQSLGEIVGARQSAPSFAALQKMLTAFPEVRMEWLVMGQGEMLRTTPVEWVDPFASNAPNKEEKQGQFFPPGFLAEYTEREKQRWDKAYEEYHAALEQQKQTRNAVHALIEHLADKDPAVRGLLELLPSAFKEIPDPVTVERMMEEEANEQNVIQQQEWYEQSRQKGQQ